MNSCGWCHLSEEEKRFQEYESAFWSVFHADEQDYTGRCILVLKRHCGSLTELSDEEWEDLRDLIRKTETCLKTVLGAALCNWSCLMNSFYKEAEPDPHLHIHVRPGMTGLWSYTGTLILTVNSAIIMRCIKTDQSLLRTGKKCLSG